MSAQKASMGLEAPASYPYISEPFSDERGTFEYMTPYPAAMLEIRRRQEDTDLRRRVEEYLARDLPKYLKGEPVLYMARHVATPNFETLRFLHLMEPIGMPIVIGQDVKDRFVSGNALKRALGKLPIFTRISQKEDGTSELYQNLTVVDFAAAQGKAFENIVTLWGEPLVHFHTDLFKRLTKSRPKIVDDSKWIDSHHRGELLEHYKQFLALFIVHGILFEDYLIEDREEEVFMSQVLEPAFKFVEQTFGVAPLITQLTPTSVESPRFWLSYPREVLDVVRRKAARASLRI